MKSATTLKFVWRALGVLPSKAVEADMKRFARATKEGLEAAQIAAKGSLAANIPRRSGDLMDSVKFYGKADGFRVNMNIEYAGIQDAGGVVLPKRAKYLRVPLPEGRRAPKGERGDFVLKTRSGKLVVAKRTGRNTIAILAVLKKKVFVPPNGYLKKAVDAAKQAYEKVYAAIMGGG